MILNYHSWAKVEITYDKPIPPSWNEKKPRLSDELRDAYVSFEPITPKSQTYSLHIRDVETGNHRDNKSFLLTRAKVKSLSPWKAEFEAHWWNDKGEMTRCDVVCTYEDRK